MKNYIEITRKDGSLESVIFIDHIQTIKDTDGHAEIIMRDGVHIHLHNQTISFFMNSLKQAYVGVR